MRISELRIRARYFALALGTIALGLAVHRHPSWFGPAVGDFTGDALWAVMMSWWVGMLAPVAPLLRRSGSALAICLAVETSQLYHAPLLDAIRSTPAGQLILGSGFDPRDLAAYTLGVAIATVAEYGLRRWRGSRGFAGAT